MENPKLWMQALTYWEMMYGISSGASRYYAKERVRRDWYYKNNLWGGYKPKPDPYFGSVALKFSLWEQAEARHKGDVAKVMTQQEREDHEMGRRVAYLKAAPDNFIVTKTMDGSTEGWKPQGTLFMTSGKKLEFDNNK